MPGNYSRVKVWSSGEILTAADLNAEFNNEINNAIPSSIDDYMASNGQAQNQADPYPSSSLSLATTLATELERYRYQMAQIMGTTYWYEDPPTDLSTLAQGETLGLSIGLEFEGGLAGASTTTDALAKFINQGGIINAIDFQTASVAIADFDSTNKKFGTYSYALGSGNALGFPGKACNPVKGSISAWFRNLAAGDYIAYNPLLGLELYLSGTGLLTWKVTERTAATESTKNTTTVAGVSSRAGDSTFRNVTAKWRFNDENGASTDLMEMEYGASDEGTQVGTDNIDINPGDGGYWFFGAKRNDPTWDHYYAGNGLPTAHSDAWTKTGTFTESASGGILTVTSSGLTGNQYYSKSTNIDLDGMTIEFKMAITSEIDRIAVLENKLYMMVRDDSKNRAHALVFSDKSVSLVFATSGSPSAGGAMLVREVVLDTTKYHTYRLTSVASGANCLVTLYIDGLPVCSGTNNIADATASDIILLGGSDGGTYSYSYTLEGFKYESNGTSTVYPVLAASSQGNIDSIGIANTVISDAIVSRLQSSKVSDVFGKLPSYGVTIPHTILARTSGVTTTSTTFTDLSDFLYYLPGDGVTELQASGNFPISVSNTGRTAQVAIQVDGDLAGGLLFSGYGGAYYTNSAASQVINMPCSRKMVLSPGLHLIEAQWSISGDTLSLSESASYFEVTVSKPGFIG